MVANLLLNALLVGLLTATIIYCYVLSRRIQTLQDSKSELASLLSHFDESTVKASETIIAMQTASKKIGDNIQLKLEKANYLLDDLTYTIEKGTRLSSQIEASFAVNRARSKVEHEEEVILQPEEKPAGEAHTKHPPKKSPASIESILEKVVARKHPAAEPPAPSRSRAEQELIDLIRSSRG